MSTRPSGRQNLAIKVGERFREGISSLVRMGCWRRINVNVMVEQKLLKHFTSGDEEVAVAPLAPELERVICSSLGDRIAIAGVWHQALEVG